MTTVAVATQPTSVSIATVDELAKQTSAVRLPRLSAAQLELARKLAPTLVPKGSGVYNPVNLSLAEAARSKLSEVSRQLLDGVTLKDMQEASLLADQVTDIIEDLRVEDLSPEPREGKVLWLIKTVEDAKSIIRRIQEFFKRYQETNTVIDRVIKKTEDQQVDHLATHKSLLRMYENNWSLFHDLRVSLAAVKLFLDSDAGYPERERRNQVAKEEVEAAEREQRDPDQVVIQAATDYQAYIERAEMYATTLSGAIVDAYQKGVAINMLAGNELVIVQGLDSLAKSVIPGWRDMLALGWAAYKAKGAVAFINSIKATDTKLREQKAKMIGQAVVQIAALKKSTTYDPASMKLLNDALISGLTVLKKASAEGKNIRDAAEATNADLVLQLSKVVANTAVDAEVA